MEFTARQLEAIDIARLGRDACVVAGPGSGKTAVLVERYCRLIASGIPPHRILAITFTEKAAANMKTRLANVGGIETDKAYVSTIHAFCFRLIRENAVLAGVDPESGILDEREAALLQTRALDEVLDGMFEERREYTKLLMRRLGDPDLAKTLPPILDSVTEPRPKEAVECPSLPDIDWIVRQVSVGSATGLTPLQRQHLGEIQSWNQTLQKFHNKPHSIELYRAIRDLECNLKRVPAALKDQLRRLRDEILPPLRGAILATVFAPQRETLLEIVRRFARLYQSRKRAAGMLDYSDLEVLAIALLEEHEDIRNRIRGQFRQVMIDEFQDTNPRQAKLLELLRGPDTFYAVGDINQSIFGFRDASPGIFKAYRDQVKSSNRHHVELVENWRSRADILLAAETILHNAPGIEERPLIAARSLPAKSLPSVEVTIVKGAEERTLEVEAEWVARRILQLRGTLQIGSEREQRTADFRDMAVLVRNSDVFGAFAEAFDKLGIDYLLNRRRGFLEAREVLDLVHILRVISNPRDEISTAAVLRSDFAGVSDEALLRLKSIDKNLGGALARLDHEDTSGFDPADMAKLWHFATHLKEWRAEAPYLGLDRLLLRAMDESGYLWEPGTRAGANIEKFLALARANRKPLGQFVEDLALMRVAETRERDAPLDDSVNAVRMMTVHSAKGLEFPIVFLPTLHKGVDTKAPAISFTQEFGLGISWRDPVLPGESQGDLVHVRNEIEIEWREAEEADRLLYVALTRAEEHLVLSYGIQKRNPENWAKLISAVFDSDQREPDGISREVVINAPCERSFSARILCISGVEDRTQGPRTAVGRAEVAIVPRPELSGQYDSNISVTSLSVYAECPRRYYLARYLGWEGHVKNGAGAPSATLSASELGSQVHKLLADVQIEKPDLEACRLANVFDRSPLGKRARRARRAEREFGFLYAIDDVVLSGSIDLWFEDAGELILVDYKTDDVDAEEAPTRAESYALQLRYYGLALERVTGKLPDHAYVHLLRPNVVAPVSLDAASLEAARNLVREVAEAQSAIRFPLHEAAHCHRCPFFRGLCPASHPLPMVAAQ